VIKAIEIEGFRSLRSVRLELRPLNVLIGPNQSGKTNILDALDLLSRAVQGELTDSLYQSRGGLAHLLWAGDDPANGSRRIRYHIEFESNGRSAKQEGHFSYGLSIEEQAQGHVVGEESLECDLSDGSSIAAPQGFEVKRGEITLHPSSRRDTQQRPFLLPKPPGSGHGPRIDFQEPALSQLRNLGAIPVIDRARDALASIFLYPGFETKARWTCDHPNDTPQIRQPQFVQHATRLDPHGSNLVNILYTMSQDEDRWKDFKEIVRIGFPDCKDIVFPADAGQGRIVLAWIDRRFPKKKFTAEVLSDGTLSFLALAAALASPDAPTLIGFDEPEKHLHPELLYRVVGLMEQASASRPLIVATHSDALLSYLSDPTSVVLVNNGPQGTTLTRPPEADLREWLKDYTLGELRESGHLAAFARVEG
jgi:predicted ATPase